MLADLLWNPISRGLYSQKWSKAERRLAAHLLALCPNQYGVFDPTPEQDLQDWWDDVYSYEQIEAALDSLAGRGVFRRFRGGECLWVPKRFKRYLKQIKNPSQRKGAVGFLAGYPEIVVEFTNLYPMVLGPDWDESGILSRILAHQSGTSAPLVTDQSSTSESESGKSFLTETPVRPAPAGRKRGPESAEDVKSARQIEAYIAQKIEEHKTQHGALGNSDHEACAREIRLLREKDGINIAAIRLTLDYAWSKSLPGGQLYGEVLLGIKKWRKDGKLQRAYEQAMNQRPDAVPRTQQSRPGRVMPQEVKISDDIPGVI